MFYLFYQVWAVIFAYFISLLYISFFNCVQTLGSKYFRVLRIHKVLVQSLLVTVSKENDCWALPLPKTILLLWTWLTICLSLAAHSSLSKAFFFCIILLLLLQNFWISSTTLKYSCTKRGVNFIFFWNTVLLPLSQTLIQLSVTRVISPTIYPAL